MTSALNPKCRTPLYLVFSLPEWVRLAGEGFIALTPKTIGPFGLKYEIDRLRVFVPLHASPFVARGTFRVRAYREGGLNLKWGVLEVPTFEPNPAAAPDRGPGGVVEAEGTTGQHRIALARGMPRLSIEDRFGEAIPKRVRRSLRGRLILYDYGAFFRVVDSETFETVLEKAGSIPDLSPTFRFVYYFGAAIDEQRIDKTRFEVYDLITATPAVLRARKAPTEDLSALTHPIRRPYSRGEFAWLGRPKEAERVAPSFVKFNELRECRNAASFDLFLVEDIDRPWQAQELIDLTTPHVAVELQRNSPVECF